MGEFGPRLPPGDRDGHSVDGGEAAASIVARMPVLRSRCPEDPACAVRLHRGAVTCFPGCAGSLTGCWQHARRLPDGPIVGNTRYLGARDVSAKLPKKLGEWEMSYGIREITELLGKSLF